MSCTVHSFCWLISLKLPWAASACVSPMPFQLLPPLVSLLSLSSSHPLPQFWEISVAPHPHLQTLGAWCLTLCGPISVLTVLCPNSIPSSPSLIPLCPCSLLSSHCPPPASPARATAELHFVSWQRERMFLGCWPT